MKKITNETFWRVLILLAGLTIAHFGVTLFLLADMGSDPFNVLIQGIYRTMGGENVSFLTHGRVHISICFLIILVLLMVDRSYIKIGTIICMICGGPIIDAFTVLMTPVFEHYNDLTFKFMMLASGCVILAYGMTMVIKSEAGTGPNDLVSVVISDKLKKKFSIVRVIVDVSFVLIGFILGGSFGIGTIICAFCVGPVAGHFLPINEKNVNSFLEKRLSKSK